MEFRYRAVRIQQTKSGHWLILFGAPATAIDSWAGVPQKKELDNQETIGFQREINTKRLRSLKEFYRNEKNVVQNPLLCATRQSVSGKVEFIPDSDLENSNSNIGTIVIESEDLEKLSLLELLRRVKQDLEERVSQLAEQIVSETLISQLKQRTKVSLETNDFNDENGTNSKEPDSSSTEDTVDETEVSAVIFEESHIYDFWEEVTGRIKVLEELGSGFNSDNFLGFTKDAMISLLRPIVIVDGQHRLRGAVEAAEEIVNQEPYLSMIDEETLKGKGAEEIQRQAELQASRVLPVSILMSDDRAEHVFQFVIVNQKATPIDRALLGTIVSTSLSNEELKRVSDRLTKAGIPLEESKAIAYLTRHPESPFYNKVEKGLESDKQDLLPWSVLGHLVKIFKELNGGRLFHERNDYADKWKRDLLKNSEIVAGYPEANFNNHFEFWSQPDGPWLQVFITFWRAVRDELADLEDEQAWNYWGSARSSNIFNKISLTILAADFFQYLCERRLTIDRAGQIPNMVKDWLDRVSRTYFSRSWNLEGVKKDSTGIRNRWSKLWSEYRKDPQRLPDTRLYRQPAMID